MKNPLQQFALSQLGNIQESIAAATAAAEAELRATKVEGASGGGAVRITANGLGEIISVELDPNVITSEPDEVLLLQDLIAAAIRECLARAAEKGAEVRQSKLRESGPFGMLEDMGIDLDSLGQP
ncbi:MAG TPA: YbaB/EbfC family nucleoid-associated protein [Armatimonadota bacterium]|nr:YbaB/EbfC family nucleoid-associated protein [Armatimonadota bacterium]